MYLFFFLKITGFLIFAAKIIDVLSLATFRSWIVNTQWLEFIYNGEVNLLRTIDFPKTIKFKEI